MRRRVEEEESLCFVGESLETVGVRDEKRETERVNDHNDHDDDFIGVSQDDVDTLTMWNFNVD